MKAIGFHGTGGPEVLEVIELADPTPRKGEILIRVHAAAVNPTDTVGRAGQRGTGGFPPPYVPGMDAAGVVEKVGPDTPTDLNVGDAVMAVVVPRGSHGAYSELIAVPVESVAAAPHGVSHTEAATLPMNGLTARLALDTLNLEPGGVLAVTGAAGALGGYVTQLAKADGLTVVADASEEDEELVRSLGADVVLPRGEAFAGLVRERYPAGVAGAVDGALLLDQLTPAVRDGGTVVTIRGHDEPGERGIVFHPILVVDYARDREKLDTLRRQVERGELTLRVADVLPMERAPEAHRRLEAGGVRGRLVLSF